MQDDSAVLSRPARLLVDAVGALRGQDPVDLPGPQALAETAVLLRELERLRAVVLGRVADVDTRGLHTQDAAPTTSSWLQAQGGGLDRDDVALARRLPGLPALAAAVSDGTVTVEAAGLVARSVAELRRHVDRPDGRIDGSDGDEVLGNVIVEGVLFQLAEARGGYADDDPELAALAGQLVGIWRSPQSQLGRLERALVLLAGRIDRPLLRPALDRLVDAVLPQQLAESGARGHDRRGLRLTRNSDGSGYTLARSDLDLECGALLEAVLAAMRATDPDNPADTAGWAALRQDAARADGSGAQGGPDVVDPACAPAPRSRVQRDHDAFALALRLLLDSGALGRRDKVAPHVTVTVSVDALQDRPGALPATTASGTTLPAGLVLRLLCDSALTRAVLSPGRRVLEVSHTERTLKAHERRAMHLRWGHRCAGAGCAHPPGAPLVPHHANPWHASGTTSLDDSVPLCLATHADLHHGKTLRLRDGRYLGPHGWVDRPGP